MGNHWKALSWAVARSDIYFWTKLNEEQDAILLVQVRDMEGLN